MNQAPTFTLGENQSVDVSAGTQAVNGFLTNVTKGAPNESNETLTYEVTVDNAGLFTTNGQPTIDPETGALSYTPAGKAGTATVTVTLKDNGGTANGGSDTTSKTFTISLNEPTPEPETLIEVAVDS
ncbi:hypothetical protein [Leptolyngbya sp. FACHB-17]|uniref:hypothetical protein n=1 Tax=unclassified Leptolyngbya TaxID=2650499 RepID=UPI0016819FDB|nr:hypothetical protein [Leptolyngbya sp. FACHB-17]MBD2078855.1 hypothetical protein [Leptolyngbya sp. FACHB-17]